jgi:hypothetical protein
VTTARDRELDGQARPSSAKKVPIGLAKQRVLGLVQAGAKVEAAMSTVGRSESAYRQWMVKDEAFKREIETIRDVRRVRRGVRLRPRPPDFPEFCSEYMGESLFTHHLRIWDVINGREPRDLHPSITYEQGRPNYVMALMPPEHGKTTQFTMNYVTWRIVNDPTIRVTLLSRGRDMAQEFLLGIKDRLTSEHFRRMQLSYQPEGGWKDPDRPWTATQIYVAASGDGHKDPTVKARGVKTHIYGSRAHLIVGDDIADLSTAGQYAELRKWIGREVVTRLTQDGMFLVLGTRVAAADIYRELRAQRDSNGVPVYTYLAQPAVLEPADDPKDWITLWPERWDGPALDTRKATIGDPRSWALVYQQDDVSEDAVFPAQALECSINRLRRPGVLKTTGLGTRPEGMQGLYIVGGLDPAADGHTAIVVLGVDRATKRRYVLDCWDRKGCSPDGLIAQVQAMSIEFDVKCWVVEKNAFQSFLTQLDQFRLWLYARSIRLREHQTHGGNKWDHDFGVSALSGLFLSCGRPRESGTFEWERTPDSALIELPNPRWSKATAMLVEQLATWAPGLMKTKPQVDLVMALWMADIGARAYLGPDGHNRVNYLPSAGATRADIAGRAVVNVHELAAQVEARRQEVGVG